MVCGLAEPSWWPSSRHLDSGTSVRATPPDDINSQSLSTFVQWPGRRQDMPTTAMGSCTLHLELPVSDAVNDRPELLSLSKSVGTSTTDAIVVCLRASCAVWRDSLTGTTMAAMAVPGGAWINLSVFNGRRKNLRDEIPGTKTPRVHRRRLFNTYIYPFTLQWDTSASLLLRAR